MTMTITTSSFLVVRLFLLLLLIPAVVQAWVAPSSASSSSSSCGSRAISGKTTALSLLAPIMSFQDDDEDNEKNGATSGTPEARTIEPMTQSRRQLLTHHIPSLVVGTCLLAAVPEATHAAAVQAVGSAESACREQGNCLETGQWDGAVGWNWGGKDRCDAADPRCGPDGKLRDSDEILGKPVPVPPADSENGAKAITHVAVLRIDVGREETGILRLGLYGRDAPASVQQLVDFLSEDGLSTASSSTDAMGAVRVPVTLNRGGVVDLITPGVTIDFGVPSQANAYARSRGTSKVPAGFVPQSKPSPSVVASDTTMIRSHADGAGLVSVSNKGLGYGGSGFEQDDEAFESSFLITATSSADGGVKSLDKTRRVVGQVLDAQSMAFLERLSTLPTKRGIKGVIPGQTSGPPLLKVVVREATVATVVSR